LPRKRKKIDLARDIEGGEVSARRAPKIRVLPQQSNDGRKPPKRKGPKKGAYWRGWGEVSLRYLMGAELRVIKKKGGSGKGPKIKKRAQLSQ